jgi:predicted Zn-dependent peptidase
VDPATLARAKAQARANVLRRLNDNAGIAQLLAGFAADHGDWRKLFASLGAYSKVSAAQVQIAALKYFVPARRTSVYLTPPTPVAVQGKGDVN